MTFRPHLGMVTPHAACRTPRPGLMEIGTDDN